MSFVSFSQFCRKNFNLPARGTFGIFVLIIPFMVGLTSVNWESGIRSVSGNGGSGMLRFPE